MLIILNKYRPHHGTQPTRASPQPIERDNKVKNTSQGLFFSRSNLLLPYPKRFQTNIIPVNTRHVLCLIKFYIPMSRVESVPYSASFVNICESEGGWGQRKSQYATSGLEIVLEWR